MSTDQRPAQPPTTSDERSNADRRDPNDRTTATPDVELEFGPAESPAESDDRADATVGPADSAGRTPSAATADPSLAHRIERTKLQTRVTALERALETSEYRQHEIRTQYERLLAERTAEAPNTDGASNEGGDDTDGLLYRLLERWR